MKILLEIILNSTLVLSEFRTKKGRKKRRATWIKDWLKLIRKGSIKHFRCLPLFPLRKRDWNLFIFLLT